MSGEDRSAGSSVYTMTSAEIVSALIAFTNGMDSFALQKLRDGDTGEAARLVDIAGFIRRRLVPRVVDGTWRVPEDMP